MNDNAYRCQTGLIGFPHAGKSTIFNALTGRTDSLAMPRFAEIQGTTITLTDIGGISRSVTTGEIPGATYLKYLKHADVLIFVIPLSGEKTEKYHFLHCSAQYEYLLSVCLKCHNFMEKRRIIAFNMFGIGLDIYKMQTYLAEKYQPVPVVPVNAVSGDGLPALIELVKNGAYVS